MYPVVFSKSRTFTTSEIWVVVSTYPLLIYLNKHYIISLFWQKDYQFLKCFHKNYFLSCFAFSFHFVLHNLYFLSHSNHILFIYHFLFSVKSQGSFYLLIFDIDIYTSIFLYQNCFFLYIIIFGIYSFHIYFSEIILWFSFYFFLDPVLLQEVIVYFHVFVNFPFFCLTGQ